MDFNHLNNVVRISKTIHRGFFFSFLFFFPVIGVQNVFENMPQSNLHTVI